MRFWISLAALALASPSIALAQSTVVLGTSAARACYEAALASTYNARSSLVRCEEALESGLLSRRDRAATEVNMGIVLITGGRAEEAMQGYDRAIALQPELAEAWLNRGIGHFTQGHHEEAEAHFTRSLELGLGDAHKAYYHRALTLDARERYAEAYEDFQRALELAPGWELPLRELQRYEVVITPVNG